MSSAKTTTPSQSVADPGPGTPDAAAALRWERRRVKGAKRGRRKQRIMAWFLIGLGVAGAILFAWGIYWAFALPNKGDPLPSMKAPR